MDKLIFKVEFLSDIILQSSSNTEGKVGLLDYIPGSNFLGIVARNYKHFENKFDVFHSGKVRFGDATILDGDNITYKAPLSLFCEKLDNSTIYNHHLIDDFSKFIQLKQLRNGYVDKNLNFKFIEYNYSQKSAFDTTKRKSKDESMYGYSAIKKGTMWQFCIKYSGISTKDKKLLINSIIGEKKLGKSKYTEYGNIKITQDGNSENIENLEKKDKYYLYANSRLALLDSDGMPINELKYLVDGINDTNIEYDKCQITTSSFIPYNGARSSRDYERLCIDKGSVIVLKDISQDIIDSIKSGVGAYLSEGFGDILINPSFLLEKEYSNKNDENIQYTIKPIEITNKVVKYLEEQKNKDIEKIDLLDSVDDFIENYKDLFVQMNSQWGTIRSMCIGDNTNLINDIEKYIAKGIASKKWSDEAKAVLIQEIEKSSNMVEFVKLLSIQMPKVNLESSK